MEFIKGGGQKFDEYFDKLLLRNKKMWSSSTTEDIISGYSISDIKRELNNDSEFEILRKINLEFDLITFESQTNKPYTTSKIKELFLKEYQKPYIYCLCSEETYLKITKYYDRIYKLTDGRYGLEELVFGYNPNNILSKYYFSEKQWDINGKTIYLSECNVVDKDNKFIRTDCTPTHCNPLELKEVIDDYPQCCILMFLYTCPHKTNYFAHVYDNLKQCVSKTTVPATMSEVTTVTSIKTDLSNDERLINACNGKTFSQGGLNIPEFKQALLNKFKHDANIISKINMCLSRADLHAICQ